MANKNILQDRGPIGNMGRVFGNHIKAVKEEVFQDIYIRNYQNRIRKNHDLKYYLKLIMINQMCI